MISVLNFKTFNSGSIRGYFTLRYHGLCIKNCRLMDVNGGLWFTFPQVKGEQDGEVKYFDQMFLTPPEREHIRKLIVSELREQGFVESEPKKSNSRKPRPAGPEDLSDYGPDNDDSIPF